MCDCRKRINEALAQYNTKIEPVFSLSGDGGSLAMPWPITTVQIEKGRGKQKAMGLFAAFCPFCGVSMDETNPSTT
jgi:hypothetical protein